MASYRTPAKLPRYSGATPLEPYLVPRWLAVQFSRWGDKEAAVHLALVLEGPAAQVLFDLPPVGPGKLRGSHRRTRETVRSAPVRRRKPGAVDKRLSAGVGVFGHTGCQHAPPYPTWLSPVQPSRPRGPRPACFPACIITAAAHRAPISVTLLGASDGLLDAVSGPDTCGTMYWMMGLSRTTNPSEGGYVAARGWLGRTDCAWGAKGSGR